MIGVSLYHCFFLRKNMIKMLVGIYVLSELEKGKKKLKKSIDPKI